MDNKTINKTADLIFKAIKEEVKRKRDNARKNPYADTHVHFFVDSRYDRDKGKYVEYIDIDGKEFHGIDGMRESQLVSNEVLRMLREQKNVRGWGNLTFTTTDIYEGLGFYDRKHYILLDKIALLENPCKEFKSLQSYLKKYGNCDLPDFKLFSAAMGGKRGRLWDEYGDRRYLANKPTKCARVLEELRKVRSANDVISCKFGTENYIDEIDRRYSEKYEIECDGERRDYVEITIKSPKGKVKLQEKIY